MTISAVLSPPETTALSSLPSHQIVARCAHLFQLQVRRRDRFPDPGANIDVVKLLFATQHTISFASKYAETKIFAGPETTPWRSAFVMSSAIMSPTLQQRALSISIREHTAR